MSLASAGPYRVHATTAGTEEGDALGPGEANEGASGAEGQNAI